jgi:PAS domain S-box-containing protein
MQDEQDDNFLKTFHKIADSELRFRTLTKTAPVGIFETDATGLTTYVNETWMEYSGMKFEEAMGDGWLDAVHTEDRDWLAKGWHSKTEIQAESFSEYRIVDKSGKLRWVNGKAVPVMNADGNIKGYIGIILDVTERKIAESKLQESSEQLRELSRHLQDVREKERMKIAREIHDELGQQLTGLKMDIAWLMKKAGQDDPVIKTKFDNTLLLIDATVNSIRRIVTELRPSIIDDLGLNAAIEWQISEFTERLGIEIEYENKFDDKNTSADISIGLFRILQESLTNIAKHAGAKKMKIKIEQLDNTVHLFVQDDGIGFDTKEKQTDQTFGLLGIQERTGMMQGQCNITSMPSGGTTIEIKIPLGST